jgi:HAD superfamily hydrolase (TIGR01509 family)
MKLKAVIFDVDGTLVNTEKDGHLVAFNLAFEDRCLDWHWSDELYQELLSVTGGKERIKHYITEHEPSFEVADLDDFIAQLHRLKTDFFVELVANGKTPLREGVKRLIDEIIATEGLQLAIATTTTMANVESLITHLLGPEYFEKFAIIGAGDIVGHKKPAPDIYNFVLEKMNLQAHECIAIEDSENGIQSSLAANIPTLITINDYTKNHDFSGASVVLNSLNDKENNVTVDVNYLNNLI